MCTSLTFTSATISISPLLGKNTSSQPARSRSAVP